jgi:hypothetical protein
MIESMGMIHFGNELWRACDIVDGALTPCAELFAEGNRFA